MLALQIFIGVFFGLITFASTCWLVSYINDLRSAVECEKSSKEMWRDSCEDLRDKYENKD